jgi:hypothetical protein
VLPWNWFDFPIPSTQKRKFKLTKEKRNDLKSMLKWVPKVNQNFLKKLCE